ncbi:MAG: FAD-dependent oxidoreductase [Pseudomonadales bacterium]|nr:FAD-dependent oxidoreductase [Pseudomonadales bacterium]
MRNYNTQIAILGGGISGLWLLNLLRKKGYAAWLFEQNSLGCQQTLSAQGMIHGGLKYALGGFTTPSSESIANMPKVWQSCLDATGPVDLSGLTTLSRHYYLFSDAALSARVTAFFASKTLQARITTLPKSAYPAVFRNRRFKGSLYQLQDMVLDTPSLLKRLSQGLEQYIFQGNAEVKTSDGKITCLAFPGGQNVIADKYIFAAGAGNKALLKNTPLQDIKMQLRPLHQVILKGNLPQIFAHAVSMKAASKPRLTITSHPHSSAETVWYLGGNLAEQGVNLTSQEVINLAQKEVRSLLPWINIESASWSSFTINRAEPAQKNSARPDQPYVAAKDNAMVCWPTKLTLAPLLGETVLRQLNLQPAQNNGDFPQLPTATVAQPPWELKFD